MDASKAPKQVNNTVLKQVNKTVPIRVNNGEKHDGHAEKCPRSVLPQKLLASNIRRQAPIPRSVT
jgi:hypothetical protein